VVGGPPCQSFSASGRRAGGAAGRLDDRGNLFEAYVRAIQHIAPTAFVFENVRGIFGTNKGQDWKKIITAFEALNYRIDFRLLDAADFGTPQHRERVFLVGHKLGRKFRFPKPLYGPDSSSKTPHVSPVDAFLSVQNSNHELAEAVFEGGKYSHLLPEVPEGQNYLFFTAKRGHPEPKFAYRSRFSDFLYKAHPDYPMKTVIASPGKYTGPLHWHNRYFTVAEYKAIQGFPQSYTFDGERSNQIKQIGNAVSPMIASALARAIKAEIFGSEEDIELLEPETELTFDKRKGQKAKLTRQTHEKNLEKGLNKLRVRSDYSESRFCIEPYTSPVPNVFIRYDQARETHKIKVVSEASEVHSVRAIVKFFELPRDKTANNIATLHIDLFGTSPFAMQLFWNAVDEWVRTSSSFQSLFELYGHFTEPYPYFYIETFDVFIDDPFFKFAKYVTDFSKCSVYLPKQSLLDDLSDMFDAPTFDDLAKRLREIRYDVRTKETNVAIPSSDYMMAYPFTLPMSKQMNFSVKKPVTRREASSYIYEMRAAS